MGGNKFANIAVNARIQNLCSTFTSSKSKASSYVVDIYIHIFIHIFLGKAHDIKNSFASGAIKKKKGSLLIFY